MALCFPSLFVSGHVDLRRAGRCHHCWQNGWIYLLYHDEKTLWSPGSELEPALRGVQGRQPRAAVRPADGVAGLLCVPLVHLHWHAWGCWAQLWGQRGQGNEYKRSHPIAITVCLQWSLVKYDPGKDVFMCLSGITAEAIVRNECLCAWDNCKASQKGRNRDVRIKSWGPGSGGTWYSPITTVKPWRGSYTGI